MVPTTCFIPGGFNRLSSLVRTLCCQLNHHNLQDVLFLSWDSRVAHYSRSEVAFEQSVQDTSSALFCISRSYSVRDGSSCSCCGAFGLQTLHKQQLNQIEDKLLRNSVSQSLSRCFRVSIGSSHCPSRELPIPLYLLYYTEGMEEEVSGQFSFLEYSAKATSADGIEETDVDIEEFDEIHEEEDGEKRSSQKRQSTINKPPAATSVEVRNHETPSLGEDIEFLEVKVATVTTKMRRFWVNLIEENNSPVSPRSGKSDKQLEKEREKQEKLDKEREKQERQERKEQEKAEKREQEKEKERLRLEKKEQERQEKEKEREERGSDGEVTPPTERLRKPSIKLKLEDNVTRPSLRKVLGAKAVEIDIRKSAEKTQMMELEQPEIQREEVPEVSVTPSFIKETRGRSGAMADGSTTTPASTIASKLEEGLSNLQHRRTRTLMDPMPVSPLLKSEPILPRRGSMPTEPVDLSSPPVQSSPPPSSLGQIEESYKPKRLSVDPMFRASLNTSLGKMLPGDYHSLRERSTHQLSQSERSLPSSPSVALTRQAVKDSPASTSFNTMDISPPIGGTSPMTMRASMNDKPEKRSSMGGNFLKKTPEMLMKNFPKMKQDKTGKLYTFEEHKLVRLNWAKVESKIGENDDPRSHTIGHPLSGWQLELGSALGSKSQTEFPLEDTEKYEYYYRDHFHKKDCTNYIGFMEKKDKKEVMIISISKPEEEGECTRMRALIRTPEGDGRVDIYRQDKGFKKAKSLMKELTGAFGHLSKTKLHLVDKPSISDDLLDYEKKQVVGGVKFGVLYRRKGQTNEEEMFQNGMQDVSQKFVNFLKWLGDWVPLKGFTGYRGGLDVKTDTTGTQSVYTQLGGVEIMFHVAPLLPHFEKDIQQVEKKRHLGNDIVCIIFNDTDEPFSPHTIKTEFNHVYAVIQPASADPNDSNYRFALACKQGVPLFGPLLPAAKQWQLTDTFRQMFLTKLMNAERASFEAPQFAKKMERTRRIMLEAIAKQYYKEK
ncbi:RapGAP/RanGAP domain-containing protein [Planoprotostelium fungivorum]|uniref:RapGAP/RanGAP domain-containing protein n=1 Tax=Planoprotostelium fungivorum TaxID=1890364 RepID=A0A2P6NN92_9EUKA|nr:RapGAP/RanGAP domain-containing protein [Planoprotostelium fungivorum]